MSARQMQERCPNARGLGAAVLPGWRFMITARGTASIFPDTSKNARVYGVLWRCTAEDITVLDRYEGVHWRNYFHRNVCVEILGDGHEMPVRALTYASWRRYPGLARPDYMHTALLPGAAAFGLPEDYQCELRSWLPPKSIGLGKGRYQGNTMPR